MRKVIFFTALTFTGLLAVSLPHKEMLSIGSTAPMAGVKMKDAVSGKDYSLQDLQLENGLLVIFSSNTCPFVLAWEEKYPGLHKRAAHNKIGMALINSNEAFRHDQDTPEAMAKRAEEGGYKSPYLIDSDHRLADAFGAKTTPHVYLFDADMKLVYRGSIDNKFEKREKVADEFYLNEAIAQLASGQTIDPAETREIGCSIKRVKQ